jgi:hypothetical protein
MFRNKKEKKFKTYNYVLEKSIYESKIKSLTQVQTIEYSFLKCFFD